MNIITRDTGGWGYPPEETVEVETGTSDNLDTINGGYSGQILILRASDDAHTVVCKDGTGNMILAGSDFSLDDEEDTIVLLYDNLLAKWLELSRSANS